MFCAACGRTFAKLAEFDKHRPSFKCDPALGESVDIGDVLSVLARRKVREAERMSA